MVEIPDLAHSPFDFVSFRLRFCADDLLNHWGEDFYEATGWQEEPEFLAQHHENETLTVARLTSECTEDVEQNLHLELSLQKFANSPQSLDIEKAEKSFDEIGRVLTRLLNIPAELRLDAGYVVAREELPPQGIVASMLGLRTAVSGEELLVTGANFAMRGFPDDSISWFISREGKVRGKISRIATEPIRDVTLTDLLFVADARFHRLILEQPAKQTHAIDNSVSK